MSTGIPRRTLLAVVPATALTALTGCAPEASPPSPPDPTPTTEGPPAMTPDPAARSLLIVFSRAGENYWEGGRRDLEVGNIERLARRITERIPVDRCEIVPANPYPEACDPTVARNVEEQRDDARPAIAGALPDPSAYGTVLIGSPVWNVRAPMILETLLEGIDLSGRRVLPFVTYAVSGMAGIDRDYREALPDAEVADGLAIRAEDVDAEDTGTALDAWLRENGLL